MQVRAQRQGKIALKLALALSLASGAIGGLAVKYADQMLPPSYAAELQAAQSARERLSGNVEHARGLSEAFTSVAKVVRPSVVHISSVTRVTPAARKAPRGRVEIPDELRRRFHFDDEMFEHFFDQQSPNQRGFEQRGQGTGFIISEDGYIVTNSHVVRGATELTVRLSDGREFTGKLIGQDDKTDVAVIKIEANHLLPAELGDSDKMEVGHWVLAVGSPFGLDQTVTAGIISAKGRANVGIVDYEDFLQTDAAINPGNSGGPLVNMDGQVVGVNTAIASRSGGSMGVGFAIPSNMVKMVAHSLMREGKVTRGWLGAAIQDLNEDLAKSFDFKSTAGVLVGDVVAGSPAQQAGLRSGDIVTEYQGKGMTSSQQLRNSVAATPPNTKAELRVYRDGKSISVPVTIGVLDNGIKLAQSAEGQVEQETEENADAELGLAVQSLTPEVAKELRLAKGLRGVVVTAVEPGTPAAAAGIAVGDVITSVAGQAVATIEDYRAALARQPLSQGVRMQITRDGVSHFVFLKESK